MSKTVGKHFKLDISRQGSGGRWLYRTTGYVTLLSAKAQPVYKLQDPEPFNKLIGAKQ